MFLYGFSTMWESGARERRWEHFVFLLMPKVCPFPKKNTETDHLWERWIDPRREYQTTVNKREEMTQFNWTFLIVRIKEILSCKVSYEVHFPTLSMNQHFWLIFGSHLLHALQ